MKTAEQLIEELDIQDLATFMESAEFEQLDELSVKTLTKYIGKASKDRTKSAYKALDHGLGKSRRDYSDDDADYDADIAKKRAKGIDTAVKKLVKKTGFENARDRHYADWDGAEKVPAPKRESIESMVSAILDGDGETAQSAFQQAMGEKITDNMDAMKIEIAGSLGKE